MNNDDDEHDRKSPLGHSTNPNTGTSISMATLQPRIIKMHNVLETQRTVSKQTGD